MAAIVTLEEMKAWLKVQYDEEDALIESLILKAQAAAEDFCRTEFGEDNAPEPVRQAIVLPEPRRDRQAGLACQSDGV